MDPGPRFPRLRRIALVAIGIALVAIAWNYSACDPAFRDPKSPWIPLAFSPDGKILAVADLTGAKQWWEGEMGGPSGPIHLLRTANLAPAGPPVETPTIVTERARFISQWRLSNSRRTATCSPSSKSTTRSRGRTCLSSS